MYPRGCLCMRCGVVWFLPSGAVLFLNGSPHGSACTDYAQGSFRDGGALQKVTGRWRAGFPQFPAYLHKKSLVNTTAPTLSPPYSNTF